jgi:hypothetical protein
MECQYCKKILSSSYSLKVHQTKTKYCLNIQGKSTIGDYICKCGKSFTQKHHLLDHMTVCVSNGKYISKLISDNEKQNQQLMILRQQVISLQTDKLDLQERYDKLAETLAKRCVTTNNTVNNNLNISVFNKTPEDINRLVNENYNKDYLIDGQKGVARFTNLYVLKREDDSKHPIYVITDKSRGNGKYKVSETETVTDIGMLGLTKKVHPSIKKKAINLAANDAFNDEKLFDGYQEVFNMEDDNSIFRKELVRIIEVNN